VNQRISVLPVRVWKGSAVHTGSGTLLGPEGTGREGGNLRADPKAPDGVPEDPLARTLRTA
jgi:hypothetical protein